MNLDYESIALGVDGLREMLRAFVAGLEEDGFTEQQARDITTAVFTARETE